MDVNANGKLIRSGLFSSALACGMLMGVLSAGAEQLIHRATYGMNLYTAAARFAYGWGSSFIFFTVLLSAAALYRRSWRLFLKSVLWAASIAVALSLVPYVLWMSVYAVNGGFRFVNIVYYYLPLLLISVLSGCASASLYGYSKLRKTFVGYALIVILPKLGLNKLLSMEIFHTESGQEYHVLHVMGWLIIGLGMGVALAWPVERLERQALFPKEGAV